MSNLGLQLANAFPRGGTVYVQNRTVFAGTQARGLAALHTSSVLRATVPPGTGDQPMCSHSLMCPLCPCATTREEEDEFSSAIRAPVGFSSATAANLRLSAVSVPVRLLIPERRRQHSVPAEGEAIQLSRVMSMLLATPFRRAGHRNVASKRRRLRPLVRVPLMTLAFLAAILVAIAVRGRPPNTATATTARSTPGRPLPTPAQPSTTRIATTTLCGTLAPDTKAPRTSVRGNGMLAASCTDGMWPTIPIRGNTEASWKPRTTRRTVTTAGTSSPTLTATTRRANTTTSDEGTQHEPDSK